MANDVWSPERIAQLKDLAAAGKSQAEIGIAMGLTKNQIAGKMARENIGAGQLQGRQPGMPQKPRTAAAPGKNRAKLSGAEGCKWPHGDPGKKGFHFCGKPRKDGKPYCPEHCAMAYATTPARAALPREAARL